MRQRTRCSGTIERALAALVPRRLLRAGGPPLEEGRISAAPCWVTEPHRETMTRTARFRLAFAVLAVPVAVGVAPVIGGVRASPASTGASTVGARTDRRSHVGAHADRHPRAGRIRSRRPAPERRLGLRRSEHQDWPTLGTTMLPRRHQPTENPRVRGSPGRRSRSAPQTPGFWPVAGHQREQCRLLIPSTAATLLCVRSRPHVKYDDVLTRRAGL